MSLQLDPIVVSVCSLAIASLSLTLSGSVAWFTLIRRGKLRMTRPTLIVLMHDNLGAGEVLPKIFMRSLLYTTGNRGHVVQSMYLKIQHGETTQNFSIWGHGPQSELRFGAGMKVGPDGVDHNHHFNPTCRFGKAKL